MQRTLSIPALALCVWALLVPGGTRAASVETRATAPPGVEYFVLEQEAAPDEDGGPQTVGLVEWRRQDVRGGRQLEREVRFVHAGERAGRVLHVERLTEHDARMVWREIGSASGRSLLVKWTRDASGLRTFEWGRDGARRGTLEAWGGVALPLYLIELARTGRTTTGSFAMFDPLSRKLEPITLRTSYSIVEATPSARAWDAEQGVEASEAAVERGLEPGTGLTRTVELRRRDGTLAGSYLFHGLELIAFQLQAGGPRARRIPVTEYRRRLKRLSAETRAEPSAGR